MAETNSTQVRQGRYVAGGQTETNSKALEWWERSVFSFDSSDVRFVIDKQSEGRADLIAKALLGNSKLAWFILQYNSILDPSAELIPGRVLRIPTQSRAQNMLEGKLGGVPSTREVPLNNIQAVI